MVEKVRLRCPHKKMHNKVRNSLVVSDDHCSAVLGFIDQSQDGSVDFKCRDCKRITTATTKDGTTFLHKHEDRYKVPVNELGKVVIYDS